MERDEEVEGKQATLEDSSGETSQNSLRIFWKVKARRFMQNNLARFTNPKRGLCQNKH